MRIFLALVGQWARAASLLFATVIDKGADEVDKRTYYYYYD